MTRRTKSAPKRRSTAAAKPRQAPAAKSARRQPAAAARKPDRRLQAELRMKAVERRMRLLRARYDAAQTTAENRKHWALADGLSARAANSLGVRQTLRNRARYEAANNSYAAGMLLTLANDMVGTGPRLQMHLAKPHEAANQFIEQEFAAWCRAIKLPQKLRTMRISRARDGEAFALLTTNPKLPTPVQLDVRLIEADQVTSPTINPADELQIDGIKFDEHGNPVHYDVLDRHPGDDVGLANWQPTPIAAALVLHWFRADRAGGLRGVPEITPALPLFAQLRRYTLAVIAAAETAAEFAGVLKTEADANSDDEEPEAASWEEIEVAYRSLLTLPGGYELQQLKAEQPVTTYDMFKREILNEIARCLNMPFNVAAGNSAGYNYSSGRLDHQIYFRSVEIDQSDCETEILDRLFAAWLQEARLIPGYLPKLLPPTYRLSHSWSWDPAEDLDPVKTAQARLINLSAGMTSYQREFSRLGLDWKVEQARQAEALGVSVAEYRKLLRQKLLGTTASVALAKHDEAEARRRRRKRASHKSRGAAA